MALTTRHFLPDRVILVACSYGALLSFLLVLLKCLPLTVFSYIFHPPILRLPYIKSCVRQYHASTNLEVRISFLFLVCLLDKANPQEKWIKIHFSELIDAWYWRILLWWKAKSWYEDGICSKKWTAWHIHTYDVVTKQKALQQIRSNAI